MELLVELFIILLYHISITCDLDSWTPLHYELPCHLGLVLTHISLSIDTLFICCLPEQELTVEICHIDLIQINNMNISEATQS